MPADPDLDRKTCEPAPATAAQAFPPGLAPGAIVRARDTTWRVTSCVPHADCGEVRLHAGDGDRTLLYPFDRIEPLPRERRIRRVPARAWARTLAALLAERRSPASLHVASSRAAILPYQLDPAVALARGARGLLIADEVGLGKTVEAGWAIADLLMREQGARILVCAPAGLLTQWMDELRRLFAIDGTRVNARWLRRRVASLPADVSPWCLGGVYVTSLDFMKRPDVRDALSRHSWDALVVDEAHGAAAPTARHQALAAVAESARRVILITATPFTGDEAAFRSLTVLGAAGAGPLRIFRRSREDVGAITSRTQRFQVVSLTQPESRFQRALERYTAEVWRESAASPPARLAMTVLRKRALSSATAAARSLRRRAALLEGQDPSFRQLPLFERDEDTADEEPSLALSAPGLDDGGREQRWLRGLVGLADAAAAADSKRRALGRLLHRIRSSSAIVFTEYRDTLQDLAGDYPHAIHLHGGLSRGEREIAQRRFNVEGGLLLATDAASEGLNLHGRCRLVINYELPWNPARLEQRVGRVDRIGQAHRVHAVSLVARDSAEDLVVANLLRRLARVARTFGARDRLARFLDEARIASAVIGGAPVDFSPVATRPLDGVITTVTADAVAAAARLALLRRIDAASAWHDDQQVVVSRVRRSETLPPGALFVFAWRAVSTGYEVHAADLIPVHASSDLDPREPSVRRGIAAAARRSALDLLSRTATEQDVAGTIVPSMPREADGRPPHDVQPGLFGRRRAPASFILGDPSDRPPHIDLQSELRLAAVLFIATEGR